MSIELVTQDGRERIIMDRRDYQDLIDARDHAATMREISDGSVTLSSAEMDEYLAAPTPLAFWPRRDEKTQAALAAQVGISQAFLAQIEGGKREASVSVLGRIAHALGLRLDDLA
jgi:DNA-binding XRE family transcriptional regulator